MYLNILREYANVVDITTFAERNRDHRLAFALAQLINDVSIEHFVRKCVTAFYSDRPMSCNEFIADVSSYNNRTNVESSTNILPPFYVSQSMYICMCYCVRFRNYFQGQRVEILDMFGKGSSSMLMVTWGLVYTVRVADLNVHRIIIFDLPTVA